jgi:hypothetical protein
MNLEKKFLTFTAAAFLALATAATAQIPAPAPTTAPAPANTTIVSLPFSEDFESGAINTNIWDLRVHGTATISVEQNRVAHGKNALLAHYPAGAQGAYAFIAERLPDSLHDHLFGRAYVYIATMPGTHSVLLNAGNPGYPISNFLEVGIRRRVFQPSYQQNAAGVPRTETTDMVPGTIPVGRWFCLEWEFNDKPDRIVLKLDGQPFADQSLDLKSVKSELVKGFSEFDIGFRSWGKAGASDIDIYYDDIAISDKPIGQLTPVAELVPPAADAKPAVGN